MLETLKAKNDLPVYSVFDKEFSLYGRVLTGFDTAEIMAAGERIPMPESGSRYEPSTPAFEALPIAKEFAAKIFGELETQTGCCWGHSNFLNAMEWHNSSEVNVAITDLVVIFGLRQDLDENDCVDSSKFVAFYVPKGTVVEMYATTLHYCPCEASAEGFCMVVVLPKGTNTPLDGGKTHRTSCDKNKWLLAHQDNAELVAQGFWPGVTGENYEIKY